MTGNQIAYAAANEEKRHNEAQESENQRHNQETESIQNMANIIEATKVENERQYNFEKNRIQEEYNNAYMEWQTASLEWSKELETRMADLQEQRLALDSWKEGVDAEYKINMAANRKAEIEESVRHNKQLEANDLYGKRIQEKKVKYDALAQVESIKNERASIMVRDQEAKTHKLQMLNDLRMGLVNAKARLAEAETKEHEVMLGGAKLNFEVEKYNTTGKYVDLAKVWQGILPW
jgi:hypothetical protein